MNITGTHTSRLALGMERLVITVQELSLARDLESIMRIVRTVARELTGADGATFVLRDNGRCFYADEDAISPLWKGSRFPMEICISGWAMLNRQAAVIEDIYADSRIPHEAYRPTFVKSLAMVPIRTLDPIGAIGNYWATQHEPTPDEIMLLKSLADITAVAMENVQVYQELEERVKDRTAKLEAANKHLEAFSYSVSHDLRNPLSGMNGLLILMEENYGKILDENGRTILGMMDTSVKQMDNLIGDLLSFFMTDKKELSREAMDMKEMATSIYGSIAAQQHKAVAIDIQEIPPATADASLMKQVWTNLLSNAVKYSSHREEVKITVGAHRNQNEVVYYVKDNGAGFDMASYEKLFSAFQRLHSVKEFEGTGVGLSIVQKIIERHNGRIWAEGEPDQGATFYFALPI